MTIDERIVEFSDQQLETLHANALRLAQDGAPKQKTDAERLLPLIDALLSERRGVRLAETEAKKTAAKQARATATAGRKAPR